MWKDSDKYSVFMLLWLIAGQVVATGSWFGFVAGVMAVIYAVMTIYHTYKDN